MKLTRKLEKEFSEIIKTYWDSYIRGDLKTAGAFMSESFTHIGSAEDEVFSNRKDALQFFGQTIENVIGKVDIRNRNLQFESHGDFVLIQELSDLFVKDGRKWIFYSRLRSSFLFDKQNGEWKIIHSHVSVPDTRTDPGETLSIQNIVRENEQLRKAVDQRTSELEQKNRELSIEAALERVRARAMALRTSDELAQVIQIIFEELGKLDIDMMECSIAAYDDRNSKDLIYWSAGPLGATESSGTKLQYIDHPVMNAALNDFQNGIDYRSGKYSGELLKSWLERLFTETDFKYAPEESKQSWKKIEQFYYSQIAMSRGFLEYIGSTPLPDEKIQILKRFTNVIDLTYTRYDDVMRAEAQAREAKIETALEKLRSRSMAMHRSDELADVASLFFQLLLDFKVVNDATDSLHIAIHNEITQISTMWITDIGGETIWRTFEFNLDGNAPGLMKKIYQIFLQTPADERKNISISTKWEGKDLDELIAYVKAKPQFRSIFDKQMQIRGTDVLYMSDACFAHGVVTLNTNIKPEEETRKLLQRFTMVFEQSYTRFLDLLKAESHAREAQIEASLERIRSRALAMRESDELKEVAQVLREQMRLLGQPELEASVIHLFEEKSENLTAWVAMRLPGQENDKLLSASAEVPIKSSWLLRKVKEMYTSGVKEFSIELQGKKLEEVISKSILPYLPEIVGLWEDQMPFAQHHHYAFFSGGDLSIVSYEPISAEIRSLLKRAANVFDLAYKRFCDLKMAEAQTREAQIEVALERIRSRSMAMHRSEELGEVALILYKELEKLGIRDFVNCGFVEIDEENEKQRGWNTMTDGNSAGHYYLPLQGDEVLDDRYKAWKEQVPLFAQRADGDRLKQHLEFVIPHLDNNIIVEEVVPSFPDPTYFYCCNYKHGYLNIITGTYYSHEQEALMLRFTRAFEQTYTRFLDLKKAEAQNREAEIELALERIRAKTMAMQRSDELLSTASMMFKQFVNLQIGNDIEDFSRFYLLTVNEESECFDMWITERMGSEAQQKFKIEFSETSHGKHLWKGFYGKEDLVIVDLKGKKLDRWFEYLKETGLDIRPNLHNERRVNSHAYYSNGYLSVTTKVPLSEENLSLLKRFTRVFEQTYTRFLDLKKAEAQTHEARIEAALERIRARAMAMHSSHELKEVALELRRQLGGLGLHELETCAIHLYEESEDYFTSWTASLTPGSDHEIVLSEIKLPKKGIRIIEAILEEYNKKSGDYVAYNDREGLNEFIKLLSKSAPETAKVVRNTLKKQIPDEMGSYWGISDFRGGSLCIAAYSEPNKEALQIIKRFAQVFDLAYRRFTDLKRAESQAREAQIEAALERVRASALAMHNSEDLVKVAGTLREQMGLLGQHQLEGAVIELYDLHEDYIESWHTFVPAAHADGKKLSGKELFRKDACAFLEEMVQMYRSPENDYTIVSKGKKLKDFIKVLSDQMPDVAAVQMPDLMYYSCSDFTGGTLVVTSLEEPTAETKDLLSRASKVFDLAYRRFLDLKQAEAQTREAQIEAALERVRARSMAMHESSGLCEVINTVFGQFEFLQIRVDACFINIHQMNNDDWNLWVSTGGKLTYQLPLLPYLENPVFRLQLEARKNGQSFYSGLMDKKSKDQFFDHFFQHLSGIDVDPIRLDYIYNAKGIALSCSLSKYVTINLSNYSCIPYTAEENLILQRMAKVFDQCYTRFLDLQKAEAQAREAKIETSLERVRAASMAMHQSRDLHTVVLVVFEQLEFLGLEMNSALIYESIQKNNEQHFWVAANGQMYPEKVILPITENPAFIRLKKAVCEGESFYTEVYSKEIKDDFFNHYFSNSSHNDVPEERREYILSAPGLVRSNAWSEYTGITIMRYDLSPYSNRENEIIQRVAQVFEQSYTRFLDLQKAEAQAREAQIEAALERVRTRTMAMHNSEEFLEVAAVVWQQFASLGIEAWTCGFTILDPENAKGLLYISTSDGNVLPEPYLMRYDEDPLFIGRLASWKRGDSLYIVDQSGQEFTAHCRYIIDKTDIPLEDFLEVEKSKGNELSRLIYYHGNFRHGYILVITREPLEEPEIVRRFAAVFEQTYTRFLDLQKAEAQVREARIEAALERVRARSMAMHKSDELSEMVGSLFEEIEPFGFATSGMELILVDDKNDQLQVWNSSPVQKTVPKCFSIPRSVHPFFQQQWQAWENQAPRLTITLEGQEKKDFDQLILSETEFKNLPEDVKEHILNSGNTDVFSFVTMKHGLLEAVDTTAISDAMFGILDRFAKVFEQSYTRFLDLKKAEAQAREAQIEASLERVRARSMAMHKTDELTELNALLIREIHKLEVPVSAVGIHIGNPDKAISQTWIGDPSEGQMPKTYIDHSEDPLCMRMYEGWIKGESFRIDFMEGEALTEHFLNMAKYIPGQPMFEKLNKPQSLYFHLSYFSYGFFVFATPVPCPEDHVIFKRFSKVFEQAYTRFLDIQKAEEQAREAQIEAALERVRAKAMAMHSPDDLRQTISSIFQELKGLGIRTFRTGLGLIYEETRHGELVAARLDDRDEIVEVSGNISFKDHPVLDEIYWHWQMQKEYFPVLEGEELNSYYRAMGREVDIPNENVTQIEYGSTFFFNEGCLYSWSEEPFTDDHLNVFRKFSKVVEITYRRYRDLQEAQTREKEAIHRSSLDRVRAEIASMRTSADLERITPLIWEELNTLNVPFIRCGVFIMDEQQKIIHNFLSTPDGQAIAAFPLPYDITDFISNVQKHWRQKKVFIDHWLERDMKVFSDTMVREGIFSSQEQYLETLPPEGFYLHLLPFLQGMLYVGNLNQLEEDDLDLLQSLADAFATAYARYDDFNKLESAKQTVEKTLVDLKQAQQQLIQSEKMASLGELTAGIAHEIQNPLNFVNNFSEVSNELIAEMKEELASGNTEEVLAIAGDLQQNLEKINHHGKRAEGIVKGMLQHSRTSTGQRELTDINALCDEYLRLAYHGMRAKDKSFNAKYETDFDPNLPKIEVIPQDIGRVILNLINNGFQAMAGVKNPHLYVSTAFTPSLQEGAGGVLITVLDNGPGIPESIKDKIFQPFFTTKPTGQGTGLGLSLSYDIIKAHGGEIRVESPPSGRTDKKSQGTEFLIHLPVTIE